jgi:O-antigen ligase
VPDRSLSLVGGSRWSRALTVVIAATAVVLPCVFTTSQQDVFALPKLAALWAFLVASLLLLGCGAFFDGRHALIPTGARAADLTLAAFLLFGLGAFAFSIDHHQSLYGERLQYQGLLTTLLYAGFFLLARLAITTRARMTLLFGGVIAGGILVAIYGLVQKIGLDPIWHDSPLGDRVFSAIGQPDALAAYLVVPLTLSIAFLVYRAQAVRVIVLVAIGAMITCLVFTMSRGGFAGAIVALLVAIGGLAWRSNAPPKRTFALLFAAVIGTVGIYVIVTPVRSTLNDSWERLISSSNTTGDVSVAYHLDFWHEAVRITADHPLFGTGQETFPEVFPRYTNDLPYLRGLALSKFRVESAHNVYLTLAAGSGLPALAAYLALIVCVLVAIFRAARATPDRRTRVMLLALLGAVVGHLITDMFMTAELTSSWLLWILMGSGIAMASRAPTATPAGSPRVSYQDSLAPLTPD